MSKEWQDIDREIGALIEADGVGAFPQWGVVRGTMLHGGTLESNRRWQGQHYDWFERSLAGGVYPLRILELGAGVGQFSDFFPLRTSYYVFDLPSVRKIQEHRGCRMTAWGGERVDLVVGLWSVSEMGYEERDVLLNPHKAAAKFFAFQCVHGGMDNRQWFMDYAFESGRRFVVEPVAGATGSFYIYIEGEKKEG
jgi:hypothetical protein